MSTYSPLSSLCPFEILVVIAVTRNIGMSTNFYAYSHPDSAIKVLCVYIRKDVGATSSTCPTVKVFALPSRLDKQCETPTPNMIRLLLYSIARGYHTQSGVQLLLSLTRIQSLRSFDSQIKRSETPIHIYAIACPYNGSTKCVAIYEEISTYVQKRPII